MHLLWGCRRLLDDTPCPTRSGPERRYVDSRACARSMAPLPLAQNLTLIDRDSPPGSSLVGPDPRLRFVAHSAASDLLLLRGLVKP
jgi:hypothetical protein